MIEEEGKCHSLTADLQEEMVAETDHRATEEKLDASDATREAIKRETAERDPDPSPLAEEAAEEEEDLIHLVPTEEDLEDTKEEEEVETEADQEEDLHLEADQDLPHSEEEVLEEDHTPEIAHLLEDTLPEMEGQDPLSTSDLILTNLLVVFSLSVREVEQ